MLAKILLPLLWPLAAVSVQYLKAKHRWRWNTIRVFDRSGNAAPAFRQTAFEAIRGSAQMTFFMYLAAWSPELIKVWRPYPILTALAIVFVSGLLNFSPRVKAPVQN